MENKIDGYLITGILARAFELRSQEDIELLKSPEAQPYINNIKAYTRNDKYWIWASMARNGQLPIAKAETAQ